MAKNATTTTKKPEPTTTEKPTTTDLPSTTTEKPTTVTTTTTTTAATTPHTTPTDYEDPDMTDEPLEKQDCDFDYYGMFTCGSGSVKITIFTLMAVILIILTNR
uniref:Uncharacterized protein n=1 Tax=Panagrellus redivivus TaxID=6233 RepID=A0A7E4VEG3_PANRE